MDIATETELKYDVPAGFTLPLLTGAGGVASADGAETHELDATYFDTDGLLLARHRRTLRRRTGGSDEGWHLKTPGDGASRTEHRLPLGTDAGSVPAELVAEVRSIIRDHPLRPVARLRTNRVETPLRDDTGRTLALLAEDQVTAETDGAEQRWTEIEVELVDGGPAVLTAIRKRLRRAGATPAEGPSKLARALGSRLTAGGTPAKIKNPVIGYVREQRDTIVAFDPAVRHGDAEAIHRMRVATRRLRSTLKTFRELWGPGQVTLLRAELKWLGEHLGGVRDPQVQTERLSAATDGDPDLAAVGARLRAHLGEQLDRGRGALGPALDDARYLRLLDELDELADTSPAATGRRRLRRLASKALRKADRLLAAADRSEAGTADESEAHGSEAHGSEAHGSDAGRADGSEAGTAGRDEHLHEARKAYKRARYAVEVFVPSAGKPAKKLVKALTGVQDVLGAHQDSVVARHLLRDLADQARAAGEDTFGYGVLSARQQYAGEESLAGLPDARHRAGRNRARSWL